MRLFILTVTLLFVQLSKQVQHFIYLFSCNDFSNVILRIFLVLNLLKYFLSSGCPVWWCVRACLPRWWVGGTSSSKRGWHCPPPRRRGDGTSSSNWGRWHYPPPRWWGDGTSSCQESGQEKEEEQETSGLTEKISTWMIKTVVLGMFFNNLGWIICFEISLINKSLV